MRLINAVAVLGVCVASLPAFGQVRPWPDTTGRIVVFNDQLAADSMTEAQFRFAATHYAGCQKMRRDDTRHLRQYNPDFLVLHYRLGQGLGHSIPDASCGPTSNFLHIIHGNDWVQEWPGDSEVQDGWFFHFGGSRVFNCSWGHYLMDLDDSGWRTWWSGKVISELQDNENDGLFADSYSIPNYFGGCEWSPCLPDVDDTFEAAWAAKEHSFTDYMRAQFAGRWTWIPNVGALITSRDPSDYSNVDGVMVESFAEWGWGNTFDPLDWELQMNRVLALVRLEKVVIGQAYPNPSDIGERLFCLGSYLLIKGNHTYINLDIGEDPEWFPEYAVDLGPATDSLPAAISAFWNTTARLYVRHFAKGLVLVNPSAADRTVSLGKTYLRLLPSGGGTVPGDGSAPGSLSTQPLSSVTVRAHGAVVLLNATAPPAPPAISGMTKAGAPFRIVVTGSNLRRGIRVFINGAAWTNVTWVSKSKIILNGGAALKAAVPRATPTTFRFVNPDGGEAVRTWQWN